MALWEGLYRTYMEVSQPALSGSHSTAFVAGLDQPQASYNASKAALHHYGNTLRAELKPFGLVSQRGLR